MLSRWHMAKCGYRSPTAVRRLAYRLGWSRTRGSTGLHQSPPDLVGGPSLHQSPSNLVGGSSLHQDASNSVGNSWFHQPGIVAGGAQPHQLTAFSGGTLDATLSQPISSSAALVPLGGGIFIGEGLQPVPSKLAERIWSWEFVEMADLLPEQMAPKKEESALSSLFPVRKRRQVTDINLWLQCFMTYISVMS